MQFFAMFTASSLPLPAFDLATLKTKLLNYDPAMYNNPPETQPPPTIVPVMHVSAGGVLPPPPTKKHVRNVSGTMQVSTGHVYIVLQWLQGHRPVCCN